MQNLKKKLIRLALGDKYFLRPREEIGRYVFLSAATLVGVLIISGYSAINFIIGDTPIALLEVLLVIALLLGLFMIRTATSDELAVFLGSTIVFIISLHNFFSGGFESTGIFWVYMYPAIIFFIQGRRNGLRWFLFFYVTVVGLAMTDAYYPNLDVLPYLPFNVAMFVVSFLVVGMIIYFYQLYQEQTQSLLAAQTSKLQSTNEELQNAIIKRKKSERKLNEVVTQISQQNSELEDSRKATMSLLQDIEEEKEKNRNDKEQLEVILNSIGDGVIVVDNNKNIRIANPAFEQITQFSLNDIKDKKFEDVMDIYQDEEAKTQCNIIDNVFETHTLARTKSEAVLKKIGGELMPVECIATPLFDKEDQILGSVIVMRDVSKERAIDKMKSEFVSVASHQLKTPLTGALWTLELLENPETGKLTKKQKNLTKELGDVHKKMLDLVNELLNVSRIDRGEKFDIIKTKENLVSVAKSAMLQLEPIAHKRKMKIDFKTNENTIEIKIDVHKVEEMIKNLLSNALKYSDDGKTVWLNLNKADKKVVIKVKDEGMGIPKKQQDQIFKKFFRAENARESEEEGTGLGLYIAKAIAEGHSGKISFASEEGKGTEFTIELPL
ncbi:PAS domain-containing protein [Candidatus Dojkabacteria bacterium]|uniref:histidine kinase n=1 Tax=Candidatus Dojkabacteria bacterium TaxID=2099670 RepID=A0A955IBI3_9BACT|nr:PAS domain-containing protein [Candidatus Dojkabacteria bacterium]